MYLTAKSLFCLFSSLIFRRLAITLCCVIFPVLITLALLRRLLRKEQSLIGLDEKELLLVQVCRMQALHFNMVFIFWFSQ